MRVRVWRLWCLVGCAAVVVVAARVGMMREDTGLLRWTTGELGALVRFVFRAGLVY